MLSRNFSTGLIFNESKHQYQDAPSKSDFKTKFTYKGSPAVTDRKTINKKGRIIWFNLPYNQIVSRNIAKIFLKLVDKHFPTLPSITQDI